MEGSVTFIYIFTYFAVVTAGNEDEFVDIEGEGSLIDYSGQEAYEGVDYGQQEVYDSMNVYGGNFDSQEGFDGSSFRKTILFIYFK